MFSCLKREDEKKTWKLVDAMDQIKRRAKQGKKEKDAQRKDMKVNLSDAEREEEMGRMRKKGDHHLKESKNFGKREKSIREKKMMFIQSWEEN